MASTSLAPLGEDTNLSILGVDATIFDGFTALVVDRLINPGTTADDPTLTAAALAVTSRAGGLINAAISEKDTAFSLTPATLPAGVSYAGIDYSLENYRILFNLFDKLYGTIKIPKGALLFHSNHYFSKDLNLFEPLGSCMKIQDIRRKANVTAATDKFPYCQMASRVYANFTPAGNMYVGANLSVAESVYQATEDLYFFQFPYIGDAYIGDGWHMKDQLEITKSIVFREYIDYRNKKDKKVYCGFILSTTADNTGVHDSNATAISYPSGTIIGITGQKYVYPEILILDGYDKLKKIQQFDLYDIDEAQKTFDNLRSLGTGGVFNDLSVPRIDITPTLTSYVTLKRFIGMYGVLPLYAYIAPLI